MRWWDWSINLGSVAMFCIGLTLLIFGHAWPPKQECSKHSDHRQTFQHDAGNVSQVLYWKGVLLAAFQT